MLHGPGPGPESDPLEFTEEVKSQEQAFRILPEFVFNFRGV